MNRWLVATLLLFCGMAQAEGALRLGGLATNRDAIVNGAHLFTTRCLSCHAMHYLRYARLPSELGIAETVVRTQLMLPDHADYLNGLDNTLDPALGAKWFGVAPPDLTLEARRRGGPWIGAYLRGFYLDPARPGGWNNHLFPNVSMPNVLVALGGARDEHGTLVTPGSMTPAEFDRTVGDLRAWLEYAADPSLIVRRRVGPWVIALAVIWAVLLFLLNRSYWRGLESPER